MTLTLVDLYDDPAMIDVNIDLTIHLCFLMRDTLLSPDHATDRAAGLWAFLEGTIEILRHGQELYSSIDQAFPPEFHIDGDVTKDFIPACYVRPTIITPACGPALARNLQTLADQAAACEREDGTVDLDLLSFSTKCKALADRLASWPDEDFACLDAELVS